METSSAEIAWGCRAEASGGGEAAGATRAGRAPCARRLTRGAHSSSERAPCQPQPSGMSILLLVFARRVPFRAPYSASVSRDVTVVYRTVRGYIRTKRHSALRDPCPRCIVLDDVTTGHRHMCS
ncbi:unnamed protein product [Leptosia nina]|uniref:Uncharacterized protein n=1 Tax=Leptosia nina TaxID=320188 RepID=A0AAV1J527_9NEOP